MPPARKRTTRRFSFDIERFPTFPKVSHRLRALIIEQRRFLRENTKKEFAFHQSIRTLINDRRKNFMPPQTEEERQIRLEGMERQLKAKEDVRKILFDALSTVDATANAYVLEELQQIAERDFKVESKDHFEYLVQDQLFIGKLHDNLCKIIADAPALQSISNNRSTETYGKPKFPSDTDQSSLLASEPIYMSDSLKPSSEAELSPWNTRLSEALAEGGATVAQQSNRSILDWIESLGSRSPADNCQNSTTSERVTRNYDDADAEKSTQTFSNAPAVNACLTNNNSSTIPSPNPICTVFTDERKLPSA